MGLKTGLEGGRADPQMDSLFSVTVAGLRLPQALSQGASTATVTL
jgi:hypothetical protein